MFFSVTIVMIDGRLNFLVWLFVSPVWTFIACCVYCTEEMEEDTFFVVWSGGWGGSWRGVGVGGALLGCCSCSLRLLTWLLFRRLFCLVGVCVCVCVCARARARVCACVCMCVCVLSLIHI